MGRVQISQLTGKTTEKENIRPEMAKQTIRRKEDQCEKREKDREAAEQEESDQKHIKQKQDAGKPRR